jgi:clan AA aspartic protease
MGHFTVRIVLHPREAGAPRALEALVDTGASFSVVPRSILEALGCEPVRMQRVTLADGRTDRWPLTEVSVECEGLRITSPVLMGPADARVLLGVITLEGLSLGVDPSGGRLIPVDALL